MSRSPSLTFRGVVDALLTGDTVAAVPVQGKRVSVRLPTPAGRRLFKVLLEASPQQRSEPDEALFKALIAAFEAQGDPAADQGIITREDPATRHCWRLETVECHNFGGLNLYGGMEFTFDVAGRNWCLEGQNGSGKSSLVSAILFALTGMRARDQVGPTKDVCKREPVQNPEGRSLGTWPPVVAYPLAPHLLAGTADTWVRLTFRDALGNDTATAFRRFVSHPDGTETWDEELDPRLMAAPGLIETGMMMPARIAEIGFGDRSTSLFEAVKALTGLDELADIGETASALGNRARRFLKYEKDRRVEASEAEYGRLVDDVFKRVSESDLSRTILKDLNHASLETTLKEAAARFRAEAVNHLKSLQEDLAPELRLAEPSVQSRVRDAVALARKALQTGPRGVPVLRLLGSLTDGAAQLEDLLKLTEAVERRLAEAIHWHGRQETDVKLRLKALAAQWFEPSSEAQPDKCPLCDADLVADGQRHLAEELAELKAEAEAAERQLDAVCDGLLMELLQGLPAALRNELDRFETLDPRAAVADALRELFVRDETYSACLVGAPRLVETELSARTADLPSFAWEGRTTDDAALPKVQAVRRRIAKLDRTLALTRWWQAHKGEYWEFWKAVVGTADKEGGFSSGGLAGHIARLSDALARAEPYREAADKLDLAIVKAAEWAAIKAHQRLRESIAEEIAPLKSLKALVDAETGRSIATLSARIGTTVERIHLRGAIGYEETALRRKSVEVKGSFTPGMRIDAALVANTSWLRAILWAFVFALRDEAVAAHGSNPFPLMVLDDPQVTFDPRNKRSWVCELVRLGNLDMGQAEGAQIIVTTHEREFFGFFEVEGLCGERGMLAPATQTTGKACIINGLFFERKFAEAEGTNNDAAAREYIRLLRIHVEALLKWILRFDGRSQIDGNLSTLRQLLKGLGESRTAPYDRKRFETLLKHIDGGELHIRLLNNSPHADDETIGIAQAKRLHEHWTKRLRDALYEAFDEMRCYEAYRGDPRLYPLEAANQNLAAHHAGELRRIDLKLTGVAAAAASDGRIRSGWLTLTELSAERMRSVRLVNHDVYRLNAQTLEPVAGPGDLLLVSNIAKVGARNLVAASFGGKFLARRYEELEAHPDLAVLTAQSVDPRRIAEPVLIGRNSTCDRQSCKKIVGVLFDPGGWREGGGEQEFICIPDASVCLGLLGGTRLFQVDGRSAEPTALDGQFLVAGDALSAFRAITPLDGRPVIAGDDEGRHCFKRLRLVDDTLVVLESLDMSGHEPPLVWSLNGAAGRTQLTTIYPVHGVLFELPE